MLKLAQQKEMRESMQMDDFDLSHALNGTVFETNIDQLCDINQIILSIQMAFANLQCDHWDKQAVMAYEWSGESSYKLYCEDHYEEAGSWFQTSVNLMDNLRLNRIVLSELERLLVHVQVMIDYFHTKNTKKNPILYEKIKGLIEENLSELKNSLNNLTSKVLHIDEEQKIDI